MLVLLILILMVSLLILLFIGYLITGVVPMPSSAQDQSKIAQILKEYPDYDSVYDLGSGWGNLVFSLAKAFPQKMIIGLEGSLLPWGISFLRSQFSKQKPKFQLKNFQQGELPGNTVYVAYLSPDGMEKLKNRFEKIQLRNSLLISIGFAVPGWKPVLTISGEDFWQNPMYVYETLQRF